MRVVSTHYQRFRPSPPTSASSAAASLLYLRLTLAKRPSQLAPLPAHHVTAPGSTHGPYPLPPRSPSQIPRPPNGSSPRPLRSVKLLIALRSYRQPPSDTLRRRIPLSPSLLLRLSCQSDALLPLVPAKPSDTLRHRTAVQQRRRRHPVLRKWSLRHPLTTPLPPLSVKPSPSTSSSSGPKYNLCTTRSSPTVSTSDASSGNRSPSTTIPR